jgi:glycopeptide antibiotics resistance protein
MKEQFRQYVINLYQDVPTEVYEGLLSVFCLGTVGLFVFFGWKRGWRKVAGLLLAEYVFLIYSSTVICRIIAEGGAGHNFVPFWSYEAINNGRDDLIAENIMNVVVFVPIGLLMGLITLKKLKLFKAGLLALGIGLFVSVSIEMLQFFLKCGFSEFDDIMHNTLGCLIGFGVYKLFQVSLFMIHGRNIA